MLTGFLGSALLCLEDESMTQINSLGLLCKATGVVEYATHPAQYLTRPTCKSVKVDAQKVGLTQFCPGYSLLLNVDFIYH